MIHLRLLVPLLLLATAGCRSLIPAPEGDVDRRWVYQRIANQLPNGDFGWGTPPGVIEMTKSVRDEGPPPKLERLKANESGFGVVVHAFRPRNVWIPYTAVGKVYCEVPSFPNAYVAPLLVFPLRVIRTTVVINMDEVQGFQAALERDVRRLEQISREVGLGGPWAFAQQVKHKLAVDAAEYGKGSIALHFHYAAPFPPWVPWTGPALLTGKAFAWAAKNPDAPALKPLPKDDAQGKPGKE